MLLETDCCNITGSYQWNRQISAQGAEMCYDVLF